MARHLSGIIRLADAPNPDIRPAQVARELPKGYVIVRVRRVSGDLDAVDAAHNKRLRQDCTLTPGVAPQLL